MLHIGLGYLGAGWGAGVIMLAAAGGIAKLAAAALEGTARQPEAAGNLRTSMLIPAALIEGLGFFALVICLLVALALNGAIAKGGSEAAPAASQAK
jgi:F-type H+-transporting ATPase subunit c